MNIWDGTSPERKQVGIYAAPGPQDYQEIVNQLQITQRELIKLQKKVAHLEKEKEKEKNGNSKS